MCVLTSLAYNDNKAYKSNKSKSLFVVPLDLACLCYRSCDVTVKSLHLMWILSLGNVIEQYCISAASSELRMQIQVLIISQPKHKIYFFYMCIFFRFLVTLSNLNMHMLLFF